MVAVILSLLAIFVVLVVADWLSRQKILKGEIGRKFIHISVGTFIAFWPFYMSFTAIQIISLALLAVVLTSKHFNIFPTVHGVNRKSWGEALFAIGIGLTALLTTSPWIFAAAILHLSLADGLAAIVGTSFGKKHEYKVLGFTKSYIGTATFFLMSVLVLIFVLTQGADDQLLTPLIILGLPIAATATENIGVYGLDNIFIPVLVVVTLSQLQVVG